MAISIKHSKTLAPKSASRARRQLRGRKKINGSAERPRLVVTRSARHLFVQVIDDVQGQTLASASTMEADVRGAEADKSEKARKVGALIAERAKEKGITTISFDRGGYLYHGRVKSLADAAREGGLIF